MLREVGDLPEERLDYSRRDDTLLVIRRNRFGKGEGRREVSPFGGNFG